MVKGAAYIPQPFITFGKVKQHQTKYVKSRTNYQYGVNSSYRLRAKVAMTLKDEKAVYSGCCSISIIMNSCVHGCKNVTSMYS
jgi:hypothetical protein